ARAYQGRSPTGGPGQAATMADGYPGASAQRELIPRGKPWPAAAHLHRGRGFFLGGFVRTSCISSQSTTTSAGASIPRRTQFFLISAIVRRMFPATMIASPTFLDRTNMRTCFLTRERAVG